MCGILGYSGLEPTTDIASALASIAHRGPDQSGSLVHRDTRVGMGHVRLSILDLSDTGRQPMQSHCGNYSIIYNGEIYNYQNIRDELEKAGHAFKSDGDTEVLLTLLATRGLDCLPDLNGIFSFALLDHATGTVTLARDRFGIKPLYIHKGENRVCFSSELKGITALGVDLGSPNAEALSRYLSFLWCPGTEMPTQQAERLAPGEAMTLRHGKIEKRWFWHTAPRDCRKTYSGDATQAANDLREVLRSAVHRQMVSDVPVGAFLSGGLDSSAIVAFAREVKPDLKCFTIETESSRQEGMTEDLPYARMVAEHLGVALETVKVTPSQLISELKNMVYQLDEPLADPAVLNVLFISRLARKSGCTVLLSGAGGDDLFTGYRRHAAIRSRALWSWMPASMRHGIANTAARLDKRRPLVRKIAKLLEAARHDGPEAIVNYFRWLGRRDVMALFHPDLRQRLAKTDPAQPLFDTLASLGPECDDIDRMLALEQRFFLADHNLTYTDKMSMAAGVETRVPFLDNEVAAFASQLPTSLKQRGREGKWILKKAMEPILPKRVIYRPKTGFGAPLRQWLNHDLRETVDEYLSADAIGGRGLFDVNAVQSLVTRTREGEVDGSYTVFSLLCIEIWFRRFVDGIQT